MQQIKIFKGMENELAALESEINAWLAESRVSVKQLVGNIAPQSLPGDAQGGHGLTRSEFPPSDVLVMILFERSN
ncbi:MAG TPA: hypothetical protein VHC19_21320 [Pirellulales bacterium]|jgi:hypothetical protein|nr:hypothetical protein [Pirellulales bacterium]